MTVVIHLSDHYFGSLESIGAGFVGEYGGLMVLLSETMGGGKPGGEVRAPRKSP